MQSSYKIIKSSRVEKSAIIAPPILEKIYEKLSLSDANEPSKNQMNIEDVFKSMEARAKEQAVKIIEEARVYANEIIQAAETRSVEIEKNSMEEGHQEGYANGYKSGYEFGLAEAEKDAHKTKRDAEDFLKNCQIESRNYIRSCEKEIIDLSLTIAKQIVSTELTINSEAVFKIAEVVISEAVEKRQIILKVSPCDFTIIKNRKDELSIYVEDSNNIIVVADPSLTQGSVRVETPSGFIDGTLESQINEIKKNLIEV